MVSWLLFQDRLSTVEAVRDAGISVCCGGILGLGEGVSDRVGLLHQLATMPVHPESVPINRLVAIKGTPLENNKPVEAMEMIRFVFFNVHKLLDIFYSCIFDFHHFVLQHSIYQTCQTTVDCFGLELDTEAMKV